MSLSDTPVLDLAGYGCVVYLRTIYQDTSVEVSLLTSKIKVALLSLSTIPQLELCGAHLLAKLLSTVAKDLGLSRESVYAWCDSSIVLGWLNTNHTRLKVFVISRVTQIVSFVPAHQWRYANTGDNPADIASRGMTVQELIRNELWWKGPPWINLPPAEWPRHPDINGFRKLPELRAVTFSYGPSDQQVPHTSSPSSCSQGQQGLRDLSKGLCQNLAETNGRAASCACTTLTTILHCGDRLHGAHSQQIGEPPQTHSDKGLCGSLCLLCHQSHPPRTHHQLTNRYLSCISSFLHRTSRYASLYLL